jgi:capsular exopolysaccharide synthesis family protein
MKAQKPFLEKEYTEYIDFRQYWFILRRRWLPAAIIFGGVVVLTTVTTLWQKPVYQAKGRLLIKTPNSITSAIAKDESRQQIGELISVGQASDPLKTQIGIIYSLSMAQKVIETLNLKLEPEEFLERLSVENMERTDLLEVSYESTVPNEAALVVNKLMRLYQVNNVLSNKTDAAVARKFIVEQLPKTRGTVHQAEVALRNFEEQNNVVNLEKETESAVEVIAELEKQVSGAQGELADVKAQSELLRKKLGMNSQEAITASSLSQSPGVQKALEELQQVESQLAIARTRYYETHPTVVDLKSKKASLEALLKGRIKQVVGDQKQRTHGNSQIEALKQQITADLVRLEAKRLGLANQVSALSTVLATYKQRTNILPRLKQRQHELERELEAAQSTYKTLLTRLEETRVEENRSVGNVRVVDEAEVPEEPVAPDKVKNLALGSLLGILMGIGTALVLDTLDTSIKSVKEAREVFGYTLLGLIPLLGKSKKPTPSGEDLEQSAPKIVVRDNPCSPISEAYRMLQANLKFLNSDKQLKVVVVTSSVPQEGKSTVSANLAVAIAESGRRVLLVDADMRRPLQHQIWDLINEAGLSNVLVGQAELRTAIKEVTDNLHVLTAGAIPPNPMALLESKRMASMIENFSNHYDFVIIDTPSLSSAADAPILGKMADGILLVVRPGVVDAASAAAAQEFLERSGQNVLGQVINGVTSENKPYGYYAKEYNVQEDAMSRETLNI